MFFFYFVQHCLPLASFVYLPFFLLLLLLILKYCLLGTFSFCSNFLHIFLALNGVALFFCTFWQLCCHIWPHIKFLNSYYDLYPSIFLGPFRIFRVQIPSTRLLIGGESGPKKNFCSLSLIFRSLRFLFSFEWENFFRKSVRMMSHLHKNVREEQVRESDLHIRLTIYRKANNGPAQLLKM